MHRLSATQHANLTGRRHARSHARGSAYAILFLGLVTPRSPLLAQGPPAPERRAHHALVFDDARQRILLTGGSSPRDGGQRIVYFGDTWTFDGSRWTQLDSTAAPMSGMRLFVDAARQVRSMGGFDGAAMSVLRTLVNGTWRVDDSPPELRAAEPGVAYDRQRQRIVLFGGSVDRNTMIEDTWEHDGTRWTRLGLASPPARSAHMMAYDARRNRVVMLGGIGVGRGNQPPGDLGDLWEFDGAVWEERTVSGGPSPRHSAGIAYDSRRGRTVIYGGINSSGRLGDTWSWDGTRWLQLARTGPPPRAMGYMAYDPRRDRIVLFGGRLGWPNDAADTWEFDGERWQQVLP